MHPTEPSERDPNGNGHQHSTPLSPERVDKPSPNGVPHRDPGHTHRAAHGVSDPTTPFIHSPENTSSDPSAPPHAETLAELKLRPGLVPSQPIDERIPENPNPTPKFSCSRTRPGLEQFPCLPAHHPDAARAIIHLPDTDTAPCPLGSGCPTLQPAAPFPSPPLSNRETDYAPRLPDVVVPDGPPALTPGLAAVLLRLLRRYTNAQPSPDNTIYENPPHDDKGTERKAS